MAHALYETIDKRVKHILEEAVRLIPVIDEIDDFDDYLILLNYWKETFLFVVDGDLDESEPYENLLRGNHYEETLLRIELLKNLIGDFGYGIKTQGDYLEKILLLEIRENLNQYDILMRKDKLGNKMGVKK